MHTYTGNDIADSARAVYLNRAGISDTAMLPIINEVYVALQQTLIEHGVPVFKTTFAPITVAALADEIADGVGAGTLPTNFVSPIKLFERAVGGSASNWVPMTEKTELPIVDPTTELLYWSWNEEAIKLVGATVTREVLIRGYKLLPRLATMSDPILIAFARSYIIAATAAQAALTVSHNPSLSDKINVIADKMLVAIISRYVKKDQSLPVRRRGFSRRMRSLA